MTTGDRGRRSPVLGRSRVDSKGETGIGDRPGLETRRSRPSLTADGIHRYPGREVTKASLKKVGLKNSGYGRLLGRDGFLSRRHRTPGRCRISGRGTSPERWCTDLDGEESGMGVRGLGSRGFQSVQTH